MWWGKPGLCRPADDDDDNDDDDDDHNDDDGDNDDDDDDDEAAAKRNLKEKLSFRDVQPASQKRPPHTEGVK